MQQTKRYNMKYAILLFITAFAICCTATASATEHLCEYPIALTVLSENNYDESPEFDSKVGPRSVSRIYYCTVSNKNGILSQEFDKLQIRLFEVCDDKGNCLGLFSDERQFLSVLFSTEGEYEIRFYFDDYILYGWLSL